MTTYSDSTKANSKDRQIEKLKAELADALRANQAVHAEWAKNEAKIVMAERELAALREQIAALKALLGKTRQYIQHINEVENSSCFYGCTCGAQDVADKIEATLTEQPATGGGEAAK